MDCSHGDNRQGVQEWHEKFLKVYREMDENDVKTLLQKVYEINQTAKNFDKLYFQTLHTTFDHLTTLQLNNHNVQVVNLISNLICIPECDLQSIHFAKINLKIFRNNHNLLKSSKYLEVFVRCLCSLILRIKDNSGDNKYSNLIKCQLIIIIALQKLFPAEEFCGNRYLIRLFIGCYDVEIDNLNQQLQDIFVQQLQAASLFFQEIFNIQEYEKNEKFLKYCLLVCYKIVEDENLLNAAFTYSEQNNFVCNLIKHTAEHLYLLETDAKFFDNLTKATTQLIIASTDISKAQYAVVEKFLIRSILSDNYALSVVCFDIMCQFLSRIVNFNAITLYFKLFQKILLLSWKGEEYMKRKEVLIADILRLIYRIYGDELKIFIRMELENLFNNNAGKSTVSFSAALCTLKQNPTILNYHSLVNSISTNGMSQEEMKAYCNFVEIVGKSNWNIHCSLVIKIIDHIISIKDLQKKMVLLLKLNPKEKNLQDFPLIIKHKLIKLAASFTSKENCENLKNYLNSVLKVLLVDDYSSRKLYHSIMNQHKNDCYVKETENRLRSSKNLFMMHKCFNKKHHA